MTGYEYENPDPEFELESGGTYEAFASPGEMESFEVDPAGALHEELEMELAQELLEVTTDEELEEFLGKLVSRVAKGAGSFLKSGVGKAIGGVVKGVIKAGLPLAGSALGSFIAPGVGTAIGGRLGSMAAKMFEAEELESMDEAEAEFEAARRYVRWAAGTVRNGMRAPYGAPPRSVARAAAVSSARRYAPRLLRPGGATARTSRGRRRRVSRPAYGGSWSTGPVRSWAPGPRRCTCGAAGSDGAAGDGLGPESVEVMDAFAAQPDRPGNGRWYRRHGQVVLVGV